MLTFRRWICGSAIAARYDGDLVSSFTLFRMKDGKVTSVHRDRRIHHDAATGACGLKALMVQPHRAVDTGFNQTFTFVLHEISKPLMQQFDPVGGG